MKHLYFCRHGQSELNKAGRFAGQLDTPLTAQGREEARLEGQRAKGHGIDLIVSSPQSRALETAHIIADELGIDRTKVLTNDLLKERSYGELEGQPYQAEDLTDYPSAEQDDQLIARAEKASKWINSLDAKTILVVGHGSSGRALRKIYRPNDNFETQIKNAEIVQLV